MCWSCWRYKRAGWRGQGGSSASGIALVGRAACALRCQLGACGRAKGAEGDGGASAILQSRAAVGRRIAGAWGRAGLGLGKWNQEARYGFGN